MARKTKSAVRFGVIGVGGMGGGHARQMARDRSRAYRLAAVCDLLEPVARKVGEELSVPHFTDPEAMFASGEIDAVVVVVPHYWHPVVTIQAARAGVHVLCEKPLAVTVGDARLMVEQCRKHNVVLGAMLQNRTRPDIARLRKIVDSGQLGEIYHVAMVCSNWYRTQGYYDQAGWRGTWDGEGGGVLINQAPHHLDVFQWVGGMPTHITARLSTRAHDIEVENTAAMICEYPGGKLGYLYACTADQPGEERFTVAGEKGTLIHRDRRLYLARTRRPVSEHLLTAKPWDSQKVSWREIKVRPLREGEYIHLNVVRAFAKHLQDGSPLIATGEEALNELEISNAAYISGYSHKRVELPVDAAEMDRVLNRLIRERSGGSGGGARKAAARKLRSLLKS